MQYNPTKTLYKSSNKTQYQQNLSIKIKTNPHSYLPQNPIS